MELLNKTQLGSPSHIIIHTGTNELHALKERVATSLNKAIEKATSTFPNTKIVVSTLLPRTDIHPATIQQINTSLSRDCALKPNVHLAHHPTLKLDCLYDHVHLYKEVIPSFAKTLKYVALGRQTTISHKSNGRTPTSPRPTRHHMRFRAKAPS
ncbi:hypothetical protein DPEC_G00028200 [Dallia pectoralis]|uniref:Uncharacterized protein n=2 Tax=Dallia pectoralis TaxID=75939 RepID=A0ACC2FWZ8_DALPE|nr:hypothetical protein DPEC_G00248580 [Dallia pectoralis]KAJ8015640.1 hypothetical protein DPEC_G00028200 [Dallia pectoralis]